MNIDNPPMFSQPYEGFERIPHTSADYNYGDQEPGTVSIENWLVYAQKENPQEIMRVLNKWGYTSVYAPMTEFEVLECAQKLADGTEEQRMDLIKAHPDFIMIKDRIMNTKDIFGNLGINWYNERDGLFSTNNSRNNRTMITDSLSTMRTGGLKEIKVSNLLLGAILVVLGISLFNKKTKTV